MQKDSLRKILTHLQNENLKFDPSTGSGPKPILLKIAPDLTYEQIDDVIDLALEIMASHKGFEGFSYYFEYKLILC